MSDHLQHAAEHTRLPKKVSVVGYLTILFAAAFLLLLLAFLMQERTAAGREDADSSPTSALQSVEEIRRDNELLRRENLDLQGQIETLERDNKTLVQALEEAEERASQYSTALERTSWAMDYFWQIDEAYVLGKYQRCRALIDIVESQGLRGGLPRESVTDNGRFSPADRYQEIYDALY